jgi:protein-S-isoprenylcysteine O-methyltransferase Ste14
MALLVEQSGAAQALLYGTAAIAIAGEVAAGMSRGEAGSLRTSAAATVLFRNRGREPTADRGTKNVVVGGMMLAFLAAWLIADGGPSLRAGADEWATLILGVALALAGVGLRIWGVRTLGRFFQRQVVIEQGQQLVRDGPYRRLRHPAYTGNLLTVLGFGLAFGSWLGALVGLAIALAAHLARIRVEEHALERAFGASYAAYELETARLVPGLW